MWVAAIDFKKAFGSIQHESIWRSLRNHSVAPDVESDEFGVARGTKQGDTLSSLFFNSVLQSAMEKDVGTWTANGLGIKLSDEERDWISTLRFPDDVLMMANSLKRLKK